MNDTDIDLELDGENPPTDAQSLQFRVAVGACDAEGKTFVSQMPPVVLISTNNEGDCSAVEFRDAAEESSSSSSDSHYMVADIDGITLASTGSFSGFDWPKSTVGTHLAHTTRPDGFNDLWLGVFATPPPGLGPGGAHRAGEMYADTTLGAIQVWAVDPDRWITIAANVGTNSN